MNMTDHLVVAVVEAARQVSLALRVGARPYFTARQLADALAALDRERLDDGE